MKKITTCFLAALCGLSPLFLATACSEDDGPSEQYPSYRDLTYSGQRLTVYLDGQPMESVTEATINSNQRLGESSITAPEDSSAFSANPVYDSTIRLKGFPRAGQNTTLTTDYMDLAYFWGKVTVDNVTYSYKGEFTGGPLDRPEDQGCIIRFTTE